MIMRTGWTAPAALAVLLGVMAPAAAGGLAEAALTTPLALAIDNARGTDPDRLLASLGGVVPAGLRTTNRFTWDVGRGELFNPVGDLIATIGSGAAATQQARAQAVIDGWRLLRLLERLPRAGLGLTLEPDPPFHHPGDRVTLTAAGSGLPYLVVLALAADGGVSVLYPLETPRLHDRPATDPAATVRLTLLVTPPYGADHFIAIAAAAPLAGLIADLGALERKPGAAAALPGLLDRHLAGRPWQLAVRGVFSSR
ncbi:MAG: hypothetical protein WCO00_18150 [Rhodospirillaceae bacterium]